MTFEITTDAYGRVENTESNYAAICSENFEKVQDGRIQIEGDFIPYDIFNLNGKLVQKIYPTWMRPGQLRTL